MSPAGVEYPEGSEDETSLEEVRKAYQRFKEALEKEK